MRKEHTVEFLRRCVWTASVISILLGGYRLRAQGFSEDFSQYPARSEGAPAWQPEAVGWIVVDGAYQGDEGFSAWQAVPWAAAVRFSCEVTVLEQLSGDWLTAGIALRKDDRNFWGLNLVVAPEEKERKHATEMQEMLNGVWLAQWQENSRLEPLPSQGAGFNWELGQTYRLELELTVSNITGRILQGSKTLSQFGYRFAPSVPAVRIGIPVVWASGLKARFDNATATVVTPASPPVVDRAPTTPWVSRPGKALAKGTGFFRTAEVDGRWWLLDPEGKPFFDVGTDHVSYRGHWCEALGYAPYYRNVEATYGSEAAWGKVTLERLKAWGFNCLPAGHSPSLRHQGLAHIEFASFGTSFAERESICKPIHWTGFPDVFSPRWERHCRFVARRIARESRDDPWCLGTFLDNELEWYGKSGHLVYEVFQLPPQQAAKKAFYRWLVERCHDVAGINRELGTRYADEAGFLNATNVPSASSNLEQVCDGFLTVIAERYFSVASEAMRQADPHHLVLGCRFAGRAPEPALASAGRYNDVFTINTYPRVDFENAWLPDGTGGVVEEVPQQVSDYYRVVQKPMIITEWSFPALDSGLPCKGGAGMRVDTQEQKAACYRVFANTMASLPFMVGYHYFMWADEPALGISPSFPEDSNYGLVNEKDEPYSLFTRVATEVNAQAAERHQRSCASGMLALRLTSRGVEAANTNQAAACGWLRLTHEGRSRVEPLRLKAGERRAFRMPAKAVWCAELQNWDGTRQRLLGGSLRPERFTLLNVSTQNLAGIPLVVADSESLLATFTTLARGQAVGIEAPLLKLEKQKQLQLRGGNTVWMSTGKSGALFDRIESRGLELGRLVFAVHQRVNGENFWAESERVLSLELDEQPDAWIVEAEVECPAGAPGAAGYRARVQAVVFKRVELALVRPLWVKSLDSRGWELVEAYWFCRSAIGGQTDGDIVGGPGVPNYYRPAQFITDRKQGGCFGTLSQADGWTVNFWTNPEGGIHPDSRLEVNCPMEKGKRWTAANVPFLWTYASDKSDAWKEFARLNEAANQVLVRAANRD